jgi:hypothetical protein
MLRFRPGPVFFAFLVAAAAPLGAGAATTEYPVGIAPCEGEIPLCNPAQHFNVTTDGTLNAEVRADAENCYPIVVRLSVDDTEKFVSGTMAPGASTGVATLGPVSAGTHKLSVAADVASSGSCDVRSWFGTLAVTTSGVAATDSALVYPGGTDTVSTVVFGSPRPAGIAATLTRSITAAGAALISVTTYDGLPSGLPPNPIRAAAFLDLQLTNPDEGDEIAGEFLPPNPIFPTDPVLPPNPIIPTDPLLPPNPIRLAWWTGSEWSPVEQPGSPPILPSYDSVLGRFTFAFSALSSPSVFELGGTVFAIVPNYYFRGFGIPVDMGALNVAKAGRAIPLKWQVFDESVAPVTDLDPANVKVSSVVIGCGASGGGTDAIEEYAEGQSGLQNLGEGMYQLNWSTSKSYAGTCRRLRLDLGERNPDGSTFYRTADFQFTR